MQSQSASTQATLALILAIASWVLCGCVMSIPAIFIAKAELSAIERGEAPIAGKGMAQAAFWVALVNAVLTVLIGLLYVVIFVIIGVAGASGY